MIASSILIEYRGLGIYSFKWDALHHLDASIWFNLKTALNFVEHKFTHTWNPNFFEPPRETKNGLVRETGGKL